MFINRQKKQSFTQRLNHTQILQTSTSDSLADSGNFKRFNRTRNSIEDNSKKPKLSRDTPHELPIKKLSLSISNLYKPEELFIKIADTPFKDRTHLQATSDRTTQSTYLAERNQTQQLYLCSEFQLKQEDHSALKQELQIKNSEIQSLKSTIETNLTKQKEYQGYSEQQEKKYKIQIDNLRDQVKKLQTEIQEKHSTIKEMKMIEQQLNRQVKSVKYHKLMLEKQYDELWKKKVPKDTRQLISYREIALQGQVQELTNILSASKTQIESNLHKEISQLKEQNHTITNNYKHLQLVNNVIKKKMFQSQMKLKEKTENFNRKFYQMKENQNQLLAQLKQVRKENIKLLRTKIHKVKCDPSLSQQSLTLSLEEQV